MNRTIKSKKEVQKIIGRECRAMRVLAMGMTLQELSDKTNISLKTLSGFENGRSGNIYLLYVYMNYITDDNKIKLLDYINYESRDDNGGIN